MFRALFRGSARFSGLQAGIWTSRVLRGDEPNFHEVISSYPIFFAVLVDRVGLFDAH